MKIITIIGARPQFVKMAVLSKEVRKYHKEIIIHTGQHYDDQLSKVFFDQLGIPIPDYNLAIGSGTHAYQTGHMLIEIEKILIDQDPDFVLIYGDTNSTISASLAAIKLHLPIGHVESGLRNFDLSIPEEVNRVVSNHLATINFAPTVTAVENLKMEGIINNVFLTGDVMYDSLLANLPIAESTSTILSDLSLNEREYIVATIHRPENTDNTTNLTNIFSALKECGKKVLVPLHPRTLKELKNHSIDLLNSSNLKILNPLNYFDFLVLLNNSSMAITDSGGVQKEAYMLKKPCLTIYESTSWIETVNDGWNKLIRPEKDVIIEAIKNFKPAESYNSHYGDGKAAIKIAEIIDNYLSKK
jgi:UDP-GlcNAc3NAcA epimerase